MSHLAWYVSRGTGLVAWGLLVASMIWGFLHATRAFGKRARQWWMLGVHRWLGALAVVFVVVHVVALLADGYTDFTVASILIPFVASWHPVAVAVGIVGLYLLLAIEGTSLLQRHLARPVWRQIHVMSYGLFAVVTIHALAAGTDVKTVLAGGVAIGVGVVVALVSALLWVSRSEPSVAPGAARV